MALVGGDNAASDNVELNGMNLDDSSPPAWTDALEETQYILSRLRVKLDSLIELHAKQLTRPTLDDNSQVCDSSLPLKNIESMSRRKTILFRNYVDAFYTIRSANFSRSMFNCVCYIDLAIENSFLIVSLFQLKRQIVRTC